MAGIEPYVFKLDFSWGMTFTIFILAGCVAFGAITKGVKNGFDFGIQLLKHRKYGI